MKFLLYNYRQEIRIANDTLFIKDKNGHEFSYKFNDLLKVIEHKSASIDKGGIKFTFIESYGYVKVITNDKKIIIISCLMCPDLNIIIDLLKKVDYKRSYNPFKSFISL